MGGGDWFPGKFHLSEKLQLQGEPSTAAGPGTALSWPGHFHGANLWQEPAFSVHCLTSGVTSNQHWLLELSEGKLLGSCWGLEVTAVG